MGIEAILENRTDGSLHYIGAPFDDEMERAAYICDTDGAAGFHACRKSALYDDMTGYVDELQRERDLDSRELYVVTFDHFKPGYGLCGRVDFAVSRGEIIAAVKAQRYREGATYYTLGQVMKTTRDYLRNPGAFA